MRFRGLFYRDKVNNGEPVELELYDFEFRINTSSGEEIVWFVKDIQAHPSNDHLKAFFTNSTFQPTQYLEIQGQGFAEIAHQRYHHILDAKPVPSNRKLLFKWLGLIAVLFAFLGILWVNFLPALADRIARKLPYSAEQKIGEVAWNQFKESQKIDSLKSQLANEFFHELAWDKNYPTNVFVVNEKIVNAFALPGGKIVIYSGLLNKMNSYTQLAALLGHEYGHIERRHIARGMVQSISTFALLGLMMGGASGIVAVLVEQSNNLFNLQYSRSYETESDEFSFAKLSQAQIDPQGLLELFEKLQVTETDQQQTIPDFLSTHPGIQLRIEKMKKKLDEVHIQILPHVNLEKIFTKLRSSDQADLQDEVR